MNPRRLWHRTHPLCIEASQRDLARRAPRQIPWTAEWRAAHTCEKCGEFFVKLNSLSVHKRKHRRRKVHV